MLSDKHFEDLSSKGYTVVDDVISHSECDNLIGQYRKWFSQFLDDGRWVPGSMNSLINTCNVGHLEPSWRVRLAVKKVFTELWKTDKLLTSFDAIAIGRPPEDGEERFQVEGSNWLHVDQNASRVGLHAYQGAVYLEGQNEDDWTLQVMEDYHIHLHEFYELHPEAAEMSEAHIYYQFRKNMGEISFFEQKDCPVKRVPVAKGSIVLWDSRLVHANGRPIKGRKSPGRWRFTVFVSMTPAVWATESDMARKREAYENVKMTTHWSSQGVRSYKSMMPENVDCPRELPAVAKTTEAKLLAGALQYDFEDGKTTGKDSRPL